MRNCPWYVRWWLRRLDRRYILPALYQTVKRRRLAESLSMVETEVMRAWEMHQSLPGQEHWRCPCAQRES
jgi:hypothetical protein